MSQRQPIIAGNWKMYKTKEEAVDFIQKLSAKIEAADVSVYLATPFTIIAAAAEAAENSVIIIGAQNMNDASQGAFTGEVAGIMLKDVGANFVILGHSERRHLFNETDSFINRKVRKALQDDLQPILCIGETKDQRDSNITEQVLKKQITDGLAAVTKEEAENIVIAYEPVWAIGTGIVATPDIAQQAHVFVRQCLKELFDETVAEKIRVLYGGSVNPDNIKELMMQQDIDGALVGGASLEVESFAKIIMFEEEK